MNSLAIMVRQTKTMFCQQLHI